MGTTTGTAWIDVEVNIPNECMVYGAPVCSSSRLDAGDWLVQLPLFAHNQKIGCDDRSWYWLRAVASASRFAYVYGYGIADAYNASVVSVGGGGIRPYFLVR